LHRAFDHDAQHGMRATWEKHLAALRNHDVYVLAMVDQAGIPRPKPEARLNVPRPIALTTLIRRSPDILAGLITLSGLVYFFLLRIGWSKHGPSIFGNLDERLIPQRQKSPHLFPRVARKRALANGSCKPIGLNCAARVLSRRRSSELSQANGTS
jgi:hypothetical protein